MCKPKEIGGLGFRLFKDINMALLSKLAWKVAMDEDNIWCRLLRAKYLREKSMFEYELDKKVSYV